MDKTDDKRTVKTAHLNPICTNSDKITIPFPFFQSKQFSDTTTGILR